MASKEDAAKNLGLVLRNASFFEFTPVDEDKGKYALSVNVAGKELIKILTKAGKDNEFELDKYDVDETEVKAFLEWASDAFQRLLKDEDKNESLADFLEHLV